MIAYSTQGREHSHTLIVDAIERVHSKETETAKMPNKAGRVHEEVDDLEQELRAALLSGFHSAKAAFTSFNREGLVGKKEWKKMIRKTLPSISVSKATSLRKRLPKKANLAQFLAWMGEERESTQETESADLATLPIEVPVLPSSFQSRPHAQEQLILALLDSNSNQATSVTAPKSRVSSQGMVS